MTRHLQPYGPPLTPGLGRPLKIGVDLDDCMLPWYPTAHQVIVDAGLDNGVVPKTWHPYLEYGIEADAWVAALAAATEAGTLYQDSPYDGAAEALRELYWAGHEIHLITARGTSGWPDADSLREVTRTWVYDHAIPHHSLSFLRNKAEAGMDYFIEDSPSNFEALHAAGVRVYLLDQPHNAALEVCFGMERVTSVREFADIILQEEARHD